MLTTAHHQRYFEVSVPRGMHSLSVRVRLQSLTLCYMRLLHGGAQSHCCSLATCQARRRLGPTLTGLADREQERYDHHCQLVASCVARKNHRFFAAFLLLLQAATVMLLVSVSKQLHSCFSRCATSRDATGLLSDRTSCKVTIICVLCAAMHPGEIGRHMFCSLWTWCMHTAAWCWCSAGDIAQQSSAVRACLVLMPLTACLPA